MASYNLEDVVQLWFIQLQEYEGDGISLEHLEDNKSFLTVLFSLFCI
jgi:hypothetical protein